MGDENDSPILDELVNEIIQEFDQHQANCGEGCAHFGCGAVEILLDALAARPIRTCGDPMCPCVDHVA